MSIAERLRQLLADLEASLQPPADDYESVRRSYEVDPSAGAESLQDRLARAERVGGGAAAPTPAATSSPAPEPPVPPGQEVAAGRRDWLRAQLRHPESARRAILLREVLERPGGLRRRRRYWGTR